MIRAVVDANVFLSANINPRGVPALVLRRALAGEFMLVITDALVAEVFRVLRYPRVLKSLVRAGTSAEAAKTFTKDVIAGAFRVAPASIELVAPDSDDDKYIAAAVAGHAEFIVTGDKAFRTVDGYGAIRIVTPAEFLTELDAA